MNHMTPQPDARSPLHRRRWISRVVVAVLFAFVILGYMLSPVLLRAVGDQLVHEDPLQRVDAMIVLADAFDRIMEAADLYRQGYAPIVILTRVSRDPAEQELIDRKIIETTEEQRRQALIALGVDAEAVVMLDPLVDSTADEARSFVDWVMRHPVRRVIVVTSPLHTARSRLTFMRAVQNLSIEVLVRPSTRNTFRSDTWWRDRNTLRDGLLELQKLVYYRLVELPWMMPAVPSS